MKKVKAKIANCAKIYYERIAEAGDYPCCGNCHSQVYKQFNYCPFCGKKLLWGKK